MKTISIGVLSAGVISRRVSEIWLGSGRAGVQGSPTCAPIALRRRRTILPTAARVGSGV